MNLSLTTSFVQVDDFDAALDFYRDVLGLELRNDVGSGTQRWVTIGSTTQPDVGIMLTHPHAGRPEADGDALLTLLAKGSLPQVLFSTDDLDTTFESVRASGAEVLQEPMDQPYGVRDCAFRDPAGNALRINQA